MGPHMTMDWSLVRYLRNPLQYSQLEVATSLSKELLFEQDIDSHTLNLERRTYWKGSQQFIHSLRTPSQRCEGLESRSSADTRRSSSKPWQPWMLKISDQTHDLGCTLWLWFGMTSHRKLTLEIKEWRSWSVSVLNQWSWTMGVSLE